MDVHFSSTIQGIIKYLESRPLFDQDLTVSSNEAFEAMITLNRHGNQSILDISIDPNNPKDIDKYPVLNLHGCILHDDGTFIQYANKASINEMFHDQQEEDDLQDGWQKQQSKKKRKQSSESEHSLELIEETLDLTWIDHRPTKFQDQADYLRLWQDVDNHYYLENIYYYTEIDIKPFQNIYGSLVYPDLLIIIPVD